MWKCSKIVSYVEDDGAGCEVRIDGSKIVVSYEDNGPTLYEGEEVAPGHYVLSCRTKRGIASLHRMPDTSILEGHWVEAGNEGMWRIELRDE